MSTASKTLVCEKLFFSSSTEAFYNYVVELHVHWFVQDKKNEPMAQQRRASLCSPP